MHRLVRAHARVPVSLSACPKELAALRAAGFPEPECFRGLTLCRRTEPGVFANTGEPRVFYRLEKGGPASPGLAWGTTAAC